MLNTWIILFKVNSYCSVVCLPKLIWIICCPKECAIRRHNCTVHVAGSSWRQYLHPSFPHPGTITSLLNTLTSLITPKPPAARVWWKCYTTTSDLQCQRLAMMLPLHTALYFLFNLIVNWMTSPLVICVCVVRLRSRWDCILNTRMVVHRFLYK